MSLRAMLAVFERSESTLAARLVLLALADNAHDDGSNAFPSVETISRKAKVVERTAQRALRELEDACEIVPVGKTSRGCTVYHLTIVSPIATSIEGGVNLSPEGFSLEDKFNDSSGDILPPPGRQIVTPGVSSCRPPEKVSRWIQATGWRFERDVAIDFMQNEFALDGDVLSAALLELDETVKAKARGAA